MAVDGNSTSTLPLDGLVVLDLAGSIPTAYCARLLALGGADVWNIEPAAGFPTRRLPPFCEGESALHGWLSVHKQSIVISAANADWLALCAAADLVLTDGSPRLPIPDGLFTLDIRWFGADGPYAGFRGSDAAAFALAGMLRGIGPVEGPPILPSGYQAQINSGAVACIAALGHLLGRARGRRMPAHLEVSILESTLCFTEVAAINAFNDRHSERMGINRYPPTYPLGIYRCHDGWLGITALTPGQWKTLCNMLGLDDLADRAEYQTALGRLADAPEIEPRIVAALAQVSAEAVFYEGQRRRVPLARVPTMAEMPLVDHFVSRRVFAPVVLANGTCLELPVMPCRLFTTPTRRGGPVAAPGAHHVLPAARRRQAGSPGQPLQGIRIIDLSMGWAGPLAARHLADLGADVIKVESCERFDWWRSWEATPAWIADQGAEKAVSFNMVNRNKRAITLDLEGPDGRSLLLELVKGADAVLENFSAGVLPQLDLSYDVLRAVNPRVILLSMPAFGTSGPWSAFRAYGSTVEHASGLPHLNGRPQDPPTMLHVAYGDAVGGINGAICLLMARCHQQRTGQGQFCDLSQVEGLLPFGIHGIAEQAVHRRPWQRQGNSREDQCPHGVYPCSGNDSWIVIQAEDEAMWQALRRVAAPLLDGFGVLDDRLARRAGLEEALARWTRAHDAATLMLILQAAGVIAAQVSSAQDVMSDPHLAERGFWQFLDRAVVGIQPNPSAPWRTVKPDGSTCPETIRTPAPTLGEHNRAVLCGELGLGEGQYDALHARGIIGNTPRMPGTIRRF